MSYWWVNHKQTHKQELGGGYLWSPKIDSDGSRNETYLNMARAQPGDTVFSYADAEIKAVGRVKNKCIDAKRPDTFGDLGGQWSKDGWLVPITWTVIENPISPRAHFERIAHLLPDKYSPIRSPGIGNQKFYLCEINEALAEVLLRIIRESNKNFSI